MPSGQKRVQAKGPDGTLSPPSCDTERIGGFLTSKADINDAGRRRTPAPLSGRPFSRRQVSDWARIELLMRCSQRACLILSALGLRGEPAAADRTLILNDWTAL